jgi:exonuclease SbcC
MATATGDMQQLEQQLSGRTIQPRHWPAAALAAVVAATELPAMAVPLQQADPATALEHCLQQRFSRYTGAAPRQCQQLQQDLPNSSFSCNRTEQPVATGLAAQSLCREADFVAACLSGAQRAALQSLQQQLDKAVQQAEALLQRPVAAAGAGGSTAQPVGLENWSTTGRAGCRTPAAQRAERCLAGLAG